jgi:hypothetical protein
VSDFLSPPLPASRSPFAAMRFKISPSLRSARARTLHACVTGGRRDVRNNFATKKENLFLQSSHLLDNQSNWRELKNGWYAITNLNATQNFTILCRDANACGLQHGKDWDFEPFDATEETTDARRREQLNQEMMDNIFADLDAME